MGPELQSRQLPCYERCVLYTLSIHATGHTVADSRHAYTNKTPTPRANPIRNVGDSLTARLRDQFPLTYVSVFYNGSEEEEEQEFNEPHTTPKPRFW